MKTPTITLDRVNTLVAYNPLTGALTWRVQQGLARIGDEVGSVQHGYRKTTIDKEQIKVHRLVWFITYGAWPSGQIDHIDGNKLNNAIANLRDVSMSINMQNRYQMRRKDTDMPQGVSRLPSGKFSAHIQIGIYQSVEEANAAYMSAKRLLHAGCVR